MGGKEKTHMINIYDDEDDVVGKDKNETNFWSIIIQHSRADHKSTHWYTYVYDDVLIISRTQTIVFRLIKF